VDALGWIVPAACRKREVLEYMCDAELPVRVALDLARESLREFFSGGRFSKDPPGIPNKPT
jgi:hypothetical protein